MRLDLVGPDGIEPSTSPLSGVRSSHLSYGPRCYQLFKPANTGGAGRDRTGDLLNANQALSQLSYSPLMRLAAPYRTPLPFIINRCQLDTANKDINPSEALRNTRIYSKWTSGSGLTNRSEELSAVYGMER